MHSRMCGSWVRGYFVKAMRRQVRWRRGNCVEEKGLPPTRSWVSRSTEIVTRSRRRCLHIDRGPPRFHKEMSSPLRTARRWIAEKDFLVDSIHKVLNVLRPLKDGVQGSVPKDQYRGHGFNPERPRRLGMLPHVERAYNAVIVYSTGEIVNRLKRCATGRTARFPKLNHQGCI